MSSEEISGLKIRIYNYTAIATHTDTCNALIRGILQLSDAEDRLCANSDFNN